MGLSAEAIRNLPIWFVASILSMTAHEAAHAWAARRGGDRTAEDQVTLDPTPHIRRSPFGMLAMPLLSYFLNGGSWMLGWASAPYNPQWAARYPMRAAWMAAAGPAADLVISLVSGLAMYVGLERGYFLVPQDLGYSSIVVGADGVATLPTTLLSILFSVNLLIGFFNLLPVPPLDGHAVMPLLLGRKLGVRWLELVRGSGAGSFLGIMVAWAIFGKISSYIFIFALAILYSGQ